MAVVGLDELETLTAGSSGLLQAANRPARITGVISKTLLRLVMIDRPFMLFWIYAALEISLQYTLYLVGRTRIINTRNTRITNARSSRVPLDRPGYAVVPTACACAVLRLSRRDDCVPRPLAVL